MTFLGALGTILFPVGVSVLLHGIRRQQKQAGVALFIPDEDLFNTVDGGLALSALLELLYNLGILPLGGQYYVSLLTLTLYFVRAGLAFASYVGVLAIFGFAFFFLSSFFEGTVRPPPAAAALVEEEIARQTVGHPQHINHNRQAVIAERVRVEARVQREFVLLDRRNGY
mmetsp:Transcript_226/g.278  ORF Transcript_226/g.278 Transcript_226/m.278 type:complete len:170 (-) Transcript_226:374-883(-)|eukprot:CAMPEP_0113896528 /NCGR_PEP_ID=MMETSP0780_2-20120614/18092_1 /TAXON_ID=652834 /ORGANISM="Palpitomonas bilix" /LENGTH=169 /DNA_ID=CAMNT_0000887727 /DNA_START=87 /DNA_END=596 /DNA_ORIENTATION=- /assembly_acc=CAM_ASM_000599